MYNIYITSAYHDEIDLGTDEHLADAIARAQRTIDEWKLQNGEIVEIVGVSIWTGELEVKWKHRAPDPSDRWSTVTMNEY